MHSSNSDYISETRSLRIKLKHLIFKSLVFAPMLATVALAWNWVLIADDGLITHRYVENFIQNGDPYFNLEDRVLGLTSPAYFAILTSTASLIPLGIAYKIIAAVAYLATGYLTVELFAPITQLRRLFLTGIFAANLHYAFWVFSGLETFFIPLTAVALTTAIKKRSTSATFAIFAIAIMFRLEAWIALLPFLMVTVILTRRQKTSLPFNLQVRQLLFTVAGVVAIAGIGSALIVKYYDNFVPLSVKAKSSIGIQLNSTAVQEFAAEAIAPMNVPIPFGYIVGVLLVAAMAYLILRSLRLPEQQTAVPAMAVGAVVFGAYLLLTGAWVWPWHYIFISYVFSVVLISNAEALLLTSEKYGQIGVILIVALTLWSSAEYGNNKNARTQSFYIEQMQIAGRYVADQYPPETVVVVGSAGYFGQETMAMIVHDSAGLFTPEIVEARKSDQSANITDVISWDVMVCHLDNNTTDPVGDCLGEQSNGQTVANFDTLWIIDNEE